MPASSPDPAATDPALEPVTLTRGQVDALLDRLARLEAQVAVAPTAPDVGGPDAPPGRRVGRRQALVGMAGAAAAVGTVAALAPSAPAAATDGGPLQLANAANTATAPTGLIVSGSTKAFGIAAFDNSTPTITSRAALVGDAGGNAFEAGVWAKGSGSADGLRAEATSGSAVTAIATGANDTVSVSSVGGYALAAGSSDSIAGFFVTDAADQPALLAAGPGTGVQAAGPRGQVVLVPESPSPLTFPVAGAPGTLYAQAGQDEETFIDATLWACVDSGTPGVWRKVVGHNTAGAFHVLPSPVRVYDSRPGTPPAVGSKTPLAAGYAARTLDLKVNGSTVPAGATAAVVTVLLVNAAVGPGNFTIWANDKPKPVSNTLVWGGDARRFTTLAVTALDSQARVKVDALLQTDLVVDVVGYYR